MKINHITLFLTAWCNMQCSYCYLDQKKHDIMSWENAEKVVNLLSQNAEKKSLAFFGGEPLLQSDLMFDIADYARHKMGRKINLSITTNGVLLTQGIMKQLQKYGIFVVLSLDGYGVEANRHRKMCDGRNYWHVLEDNLKNISVKSIGAVRMTIMPDSVSKLYDNYLGLLSQGFDRINFALDYTSAWTDQDIEIYRSQFIKVLQLYYDQIAQNKKVGIDFVDYIVLNALGRTKIACHYGLGSYAVSAKGYVFPCHREVMDTISDNGTPLDEFALRGLEKKYTCIKKEDIICQQCDLYDRCSICMVNIRKMGGSLKSIPELICNVNKIHILETDRMLSKLYYKHRKQFQNKYLESVNLN